jgi:hypothetical protein
MIVRIAVGVATIIVTLLLLALLDRDASSRVPFDCFDPTERERVRELALKGIDEGLVQAMTHLYTVWQKDPSIDQPKRAQVGTSNAVNAHNRARRYALDWQPPSCEGEAK